LATKIVFIGLGNMGLPMALNLVRKGDEVCGFDLSPPAVEKLVQGGGRAGADRAAEVAAADIVITMLPASKHVEETLLGSGGDGGNGGAVAAAKAGALLIDCSSVAPATARRVADAAAARGLDCLDAPVSGGTAGATNGTLTFMVGGSAATLERARPTLQKMGKALFHAGGHGAGQTAKICNNMMLGIQMVGACEAIRLGQANGLDAAVLSDIMAKSSGRNWVLELYNPCPGVMDNVPASRGYSGGFGVDLMLKDLGLAMEAAVASSASIPLGALARNLFDLHSKAGAGALDFSSIFRTFERRPA